MKRAAHRPNTIQKFGSASTVIGIALSIAERVANYQKEEGLKSKTQALSELLDEVLTAKGF